MEVEAKVVSTTTVVSVFSALVCPVCLESIMGVAVILLFEVTRESVVGEVPSSSLTLVNRELGRAVVAEP